VLLLNVGDHLDAWKYIRDKLGATRRRRGRSTSATWTP
jgi:hypothetical protein